MLLCVAGNIEERDPQSRALATHRQRPAWGVRGQDAEPFPWCGVRALSCG